MQLQWAKAAGNEWCLLEEVDLGRLGHHGVFIIWRNGNAAEAPAILYVGRGPLRRQLAECQRNPLFRSSPGLRVTWANVDNPGDLDAIATYLYRRLHPTWGEVLAVPQPMAVNLPLTTEARATPRAGDS